MIVPTRMLNTKRIWPLLDLFFHSPAGKVILISVSCWLLSFTYLKQRYWRDPQSAFFNSDHVYDLKYSAFRESQANTYINLASQRYTTLQKASAHPEICAAFLTVAREEKNYMAQAVGSMLEGLVNEERANLFVYVLFANTEPSIHPDWNATWLNKAVDSAGTYQVNAETLARLQELEGQRNFYEKGVFDYVHALNACYAANTPYIAIFEDDIILADGWLAKTRKALREIERESLDGGRFWNWIYLRLFYTETSLQWGPEDFWYAHMYFTFVFAACVGYILLVGTRTFIPRTRKLLDNYAIGFLCVVTVPAFAGLAFMIGKYSLFPPHGVFELNKHGCCTQAMVFPRDQVPGISQFLSEANSGQADTILENYADRTGKQRLALGPQVAQHIGLVNSRDNFEVTSRRVWAFWFEENNPEKLRREHERLLEPM